MNLPAIVCFLVGLTLIVIGTLAITKGKSVYQLMFAFIPIIFGIQQITEAFLWIFLQYRAYDPIKHDLTHVYLFLAEVIWPLWILISIILIEKNNVLKIIQLVLLSLGMFVSAYLAFNILTFNADAVIVDSHIHYAQRYLSPFTVSNSIPYLTVTILPFFISSVKRMWFIGVGFLVSYIIAMIFYTDFLVSTWSFFASLTSLLVYPVIADVGKSVKKYK